MTQGASEIRGGAGVKCYFYKWGVDLTQDFFFNIEVKSINLVHFESKIKRFMDTSLNIHMKQNCKQIYYFFMDILQITPLLNSILVLLSYSISCLVSYSDEYQETAFGTLVQEVTVPDG